MERHLKLAEPQDFETPVVREIKPPKGFNLAYLRSIQTLPDNVFLLRPMPEASTEPLPDIVA